MPKFMVYESAQTVYIYEVEAKTADDAQEIVDEGYSDPIRTEYIEREIYDIRESGDDN
jgi:hypothetical protein